MNMAIKQIYREEIMSNDKKYTGTPIIFNDLVTQYKKCGVKAGQTIIVHISLKKIGWIVGGSETLIRALLEVVGSEGTIVMPSQTWKNLDPSTGVHWEQPEEWWPVIRENWPAYDPDVTPAIGMGISAEMFRKWPGAKRSNHPARSFAAVGKNAEYIVKDHDLENIFGSNSPLDKIYKLDGNILLIGVGFDKNTSLHLAETKADYQGKKFVEESSAILINGKREWVTYHTLDVDDKDFIKLENDYKLENEVIEKKIGNADTLFLSQRDVVDWSVKWMEKNR